MNGQDEKHRWSWDWLKNATGVATHSPRLLGGFTQGKSLWEAPQSSTTFLLQTNLLQFVKSL